MSSKIYITGHMFPSTDYDSILSSILLEDFIKVKYNLDAKPIVLNKLDKYKKEILNKLNIKLLKKTKFKKNDKFCIVDHNNLDLSLNQLNLDNTIYGIVDHHIDNNLNYEKFKYIKKIGATASIIYDLYKKNNIKINKQKAILFLYAIISDTINLKSTTTTKKDKDIVKEIYEKYNIKIKPENILKKLFNKDIFKNKSLNYIVNYDLKFFKYKNKKIYVSEVKMDNKDILNKLNNSKLNLKDASLFVIKVSDISENKSYVYYFGNLSNKYKYSVYNKLISRKNDLYTIIKSKL